MNHETRNMNDHSPDGIYFAGKTFTAAEWDALITRRPDEHRNQHAHRLAFGLGCGCATTAPRGERGK